MRLSHLLQAFLTSAAVAWPHHQCQSSEDEVSIFSTITVARGRYERFTEVIDETLKWVQENEPGTLQLELYRTAEYANGTEVSLFEKYANLAARNLHANSQQYADLIATLTGEELLLGEPNLSYGNFTQGFERPCRGRH